MSRSVQAMLPVSRSDDGVGKGVGYRVRSSSYVYDSTPQYCKATESLIRFVAIIASHNDPLVIALDNAFIVSVYAVLASVQPYS